MRREFTSVVKWDPRRPVPWRRLAVEWMFIAVVVAVISLLVSHNRNVGSYLTILFGGVIYVGFGAILAKLGYVRKTLRQMRAETAAATARPTSSTSSTSSARPRPAPTKRTSTGPSQRPTKKKR
jgi:hypothetical protein